MGSGLRLGEDNGMMGLNQQGIQAQIIALSFSLQ